MKLSKDKLNIIISVLLILTIGLLAGYSLGYFRAIRNQFPEIEFVNEINPGIATIKLLEVKNGRLYGKISGRETRIAFGPDDILELKKEDEFEIPLNSIRLKHHYQTSDIPTDAQFVASKTGKYYYSVFKKQALNLKPQNRIYFSSASEAEKMGYIEKQ